MIAIESISGELQNANDGGGNQAQRDFNPIPPSFWANNIL